MDQARAKMWQGKSNPNKHGSKLARMTGKLQDVAPREKSMKSTEIYYLRLEQLKILGNLN